MTAPHDGLLAGYPAVSGCFDELIGEGGAPRPEFRRSLDMLAALSPDEFARTQGLAELALLNQGVTFCVYQDTRGTEKILPFCLIPRMISSRDWAPLERGLEQRLRALNLFLDDIYGDQRILAEGAVPAELVLGAAGYNPALRGIVPAGGVRMHIAGIDLVRDPHGVFRVLEDNLRTPSGVSYVVENRVLSKRIHPRMVDAARVQHVEHYPARLAETLRSVSPVAPEATNAGRAHARPVQLGLLRAHVPGPQHGRRAGAGLRPARRRRPGLPAHHARAAPGPRDLSPHRRRVPRSGVRSAPTACSACPASCARGRAARWRWSTRRATAWPTTRRSIRSCRT